MKNKLNFLVILAVAPLFASCFGPSTPADAQGMGPKEQVEAFFSSVKAGKLESAYEVLFAPSGIAQMKPQAVEALRRQTEAYLPLFGKIVGWELVHEEAFGASVVRLVYLLKANHHALTWEFYFYKPAESWFLVQVTFDDQFRALGPKVSIGGRPSA